MLSAFIQHICMGLDQKLREGEERVADTYSGVHMNPAHGTLNPQLLSRSCEVADHVGTQGLVVNGGCVHRVFSEKVIVEGQMGQRDRDATLQGETPIRIRSLGKLSVQVGQGVQM